MNFVVCMNVKTNLKERMTGQYRYKDAETNYASVKKEEREKKCLS
jgi:hypothetical protein